jgi:NitT/TauT family transport system ATP-binding protein
MMQTTPAPDADPRVSPTDTRLSCLAVSMTYPDGTVALDNVSLALEPGEFTALVGPSGCGKSTLLRVLSGLETPVSGHMEIDRTTLGYTFQDATLLPWRNVQRNAELLLELRGVEAAERRAIAGRNLRQVGLGGFENHYPKQLSGGMKMRASLARSLALEPRVFLFDEPFGALDEMTRQRLNDELLSQFSSHGFAALFVTHSVQEAVYLSSRVLVMSSRPGRIVDQIHVPWPYPRLPELRYDPEFARLCGHVSRALQAGDTMSAQ